MIGDKDPEDAYDHGDPIDVRLALLVRIVIAIAADPDLARAVRRRLEVARLLRRIGDELVG